MLPKLPTVNIICGEHTRYIVNEEYRCALVADAVYNNESLPHCGLPHATEKQVRDVFRGDLSFVDIRDGVRERLYYDQHSGNYILGFAETRQASADDMSQNISQFFGHGSDYYQRGVALAQAIKPAYRNKVIATGHSLGGGVATVAAIAGDLRAIVFNPPSLHNDTIANFGEANIASARRKIQRFVVTGEFVDLINKTAGLALRHRFIGDRVSLDGSMNVPVELHAMKEVFIELKNSLARQKYPHAVDSVSSFPPFFMRYQPCHHHHSRQNRLIACSPT